MMMVKVMKRKLKRMTSNIQNFLSIVLVLFSAQALSDVIIYPTTGLNLSATPGFSSDSSLIFKPSADQTSAVQYRLTTFRVNDKDVDKSKFKIKTLYSSEFKPLDRYQLVLSGKENENPVNANFKFEPTWFDIPGVYSGIISSDTNTPDIPIKITVNPITTLSIDPDNFKITTSTTNIPKIREVDVVFASNSTRWDLYVSAENLIKNTGDRINKDRVFVRIKNDSKSGSWLALNQPTKIISGYASPPTKIATLEFFVNANKLEKTGDYLGKIKFLVKNY